MDYQEFKEDKRALRDLLAIDRTAMANERTFLAYARTAIMLAATAVTLIKLFPSPLARYAGFALLPLAFIIFAAGAKRYWALSRALQATRQ